MNLFKNIELKVVGEKVEVEEIFLTGNVSEIKEIYNHSISLFDNSPSDFTVKLITKNRNILFIRFLDDKFYIGKFRHMY